MSTNIATGRSTHSDTARKDRCFKIILQIFFVVVSGDPYVCRDNALGSILSSETVPAGEATQLCHSGEKTEKQKEQRREKRIDVEN